MNYFEILGLPISFDLETELLEVKLLQKQKESHPDIIKDPQQSYNSSLVNKAYHVLKNKMLRAEHIIELWGYNFNNTNLQLSADFLQQNMHWRVLLMEAGSKEEIIFLLKDIITLEDESFKNLQDAFTKKLSNEAMQIYTKLKFIQRFKQEIIEKLDTYE
jgi:molecular chaperone HscB